MGKKCNHIVAVVSKYVNHFDVVNEKKIMQVYKEYITEHCSFRDYRKRGEYWSHNFIMECGDLKNCFFDYCPKCGEKLNPEDLKQRINTELLPFYRKIKEKAIEKEKKDKIERQKKKQLEKFLIENPPIVLGYVYIIKFGKYYKIGKTRTPKQRMDAFCNFPEKIEIIKIAHVWGYSEIEKELHEKYKEYRVKGEWFDLNTELLEEVKQILDAKDYPEFYRIEE